MSGFLCGDIFKYNFLLPYGFKLPVFKNDFVAAVSVGTAIGGSVIADHIAGIKSVSVFAGVDVSALEWDV